MLKRMLLCAGLFIVLLLSGCENEDSNIVESQLKYSVRNIYWTARTDIDHDGYASNGTLNVEVDIGKNVSREISVRFFYKGANEDRWVWLGDKNVTVTGNKNDAISYPGIGSKFYYGLYDFRVIVSAWQESNLYFNAVIDAYTNATLDDQKFEYNGEDLRFEP